jgi:hypothetical protein
MPVDRSGLPRGRPGGRTPEQLAATSPARQRLQATRSVRQLEALSVDTIGYAEGGKENLQKCGFRHRGGEPKMSETMPTAEEDRPIVTSFGTVTKNQVIYRYKRGWFSKGSREDLPLRHVTSCVWRHRGIP